MGFMGIFVLLMVGFRQTFSASDEMYRNIYKTLHNEPPPPREKNRVAAVTTEYMDQKIDNFNKTDTRTYKMRYMINSHFAQKGGPMLINVGGEWEISQDGLLGGQIVEIGRATNGTLFNVEHRYYGNSTVFSDLSTENLKYLSVDQALEDLANFIRTIKNTIPNLKDSKVILFGASYAGTMVTWFSAKHPELVNGAWASSAPLLAKADLHEYKVVEGQSLKVSGYGCFNKIGRTIRFLEISVKNHDIESFSDALTICPTFCTTKELDVMTLFVTISDIFAGVIQGRDIRGITEMCQHILSEEDDITGVGQWIHSYLGIRGCLDFSYKAWTQEFKDKNSYNYATMRKWFYQACNEFGWFSTTRCCQQPFGSSVPLKFYINACRNIFGYKRYTKLTLKKHVKHTNVKFGGLQPKVKNVYFSQGSLDPWRAVGIQKDGEYSTVIPFYSHCQDLGGTYIDDSLQMAAAKRKGAQLIYKWLGP